MLKKIIIIIIIKPTLLYQIPKPSASRSDDIFIKAGTISTIRSCKHKFDVAVKGVLSCLS